MVFFATAGYIIIYQQKSDQVLLSLNVVAQKAPYHSRHTKKEARKASHNVLISFKW